MHIYLELEDYLAQWFVSDMGGQRPVRLKRGCAEATYLEIFLTTPPKDFVPQRPPQGAVCIELPNFRTKDTRYSHFLPPKASEGLKAIIRGRFDIEMWKELSSFANLFKRQDMLIYAFMEKHGIEQNDKNWNAIAKRFKRKRDVYAKITRRKKNDKNDSDFNEDF